jgi:rare lipoprotein A
MILRNALFTLLATVGFLLFVWNFAPVRAAECGIASWYGTENNQTVTATGERYTGRDFTAAHRTLPFGTKLKVTYNGKSVIVRLNDRGPYVKGRVLDLSKAAAAKIGLIRSGTGRVCWTKVR